MHNGELMYVANFNDLVKHYSIPEDKRRWFWDKIQEKAIKSPSFRAYVLIFWNKILPALGRERPTNIKVPWKVEGQVILLH